MRCIKFGLLLSLLAILAPLIGAYVRDAGDAGLGWLSALAGWVYFVGFIAFPTALFLGVALILAGLVLVFRKWGNT